MINSERKALFTLNLPELVTWFARMMTLTGLFIPCCPKYWNILSLRKTPAMSKKTMRDANSLLRDMSNKRTGLVYKCNSLAFAPEASIFQGCR